MIDHYRFLLRCSLAIILSLFSNSTLSAQSVVISEFMASNDNILNDEDGDSEDWIEIFNEGASVVNLTGWHLTDDAALLTKWTFPNVTLDPGELLVVFASNKDRADPG